MLGSSWSRSVAARSPWLALLCAASLSVVSPSAAQTEPSAAAVDAAGDTQRREAKERFLRGLELANEDNWDAALVEFMASRELFPTRAALSNIPLSLRHLKRYAEAVEAYGEYLQKFGAGMPAEERKKVDEALGELRSFVGEIDVETEQKGAVVVVDGQQRGTTPLPTPIVVNAGTHSVRVLREGFEGFEATLPVAGKQRKVVQAKLRRLASSGNLIVREAAGQALDVLIDGAVVGKSPWQGSVSVGLHGVALRGEGDLGSPPNAAAVKANETATITLIATTLDAKMRVEPVPANARIDVDGVSVGAGVWEGKLVSGSHRLEVTAPGHTPYRKDVKIASGHREVVRVSLERDLSDPAWKESFRPHPFVELVGGLAWANGFGTDADSACDQRVSLAEGDVPGCSEHTAALGFVAGGRGGYQLTGGLALEVFLGYVSMSESSVRALVARGEARTEAQLSFSSARAKDSTALKAPLAAFSASYQLLDKTPLTFRIWAGALRANVKHGLSGEFSGDVPYSENMMALSQTVTQSITVREPSQNIWVPLIGPEVRFGYRFSKRFAVDVGVAGFLFLGPGEHRSGGNIGASDERPTLLDEVPSESGAAVVKPGVIRFEREKSVATFFGVLPTLGARVDF